MIQSMTGYGKEVIQLPSKTITIEIKSLNSKGLDLNTRVPIAYREKEMEIRDLLAKSLVRGKIDFSIYVETTSGATTTQINDDVVRKYMEELSKIVEGDPMELLKIAVSMPDTMRTQVEEIDQEEYRSILEGIDAALIAINKFRTDEGRVLGLDFSQRIETISQLLDEVKEVGKERIPEVRERLRKAVSELEEKVDENRFEQELIYYLEKYDITEETVRLKNHLDYFEKALTSEESNGKKLAFITQEIGREINTIGSKANQATMQQLVVQMKDELEKIKEQMLNVL
jgi:uncharacterized protein (TIGR00255 family)